MNYSAGVYLFDASDGFSTILSSDMDDATALGKFAELARQ